MSTRSVDRWNGRGGRCISAWFAIVALLLGALLPAGFSLAAADAPAIGFCGSPPAPGHKQLPPAGAHCIYCLAVPIGSAPAPMAALATPQLIGGIAVPLLHRWSVERPAPFAAAQPRGPPAAA